MSYQKLKVALIASNNDDYLVAKKNLLGLIEAELDLSVQTFEEKTWQNVDLIFRCIGSQESADTLQTEIDTISLLNKSYALMVFVDEPYVHLPCLSDIHEEHLVRFPASTEFVNLRVNLAITEIHVRHGQGRAANLRLGDILLNNGMIKQDQLDQALAYQKEHGVRIGHALVALKMISEHERLHLLAAQQGVELATTGMLAKADLDAVVLIPEEIAKQHQCLAFKRLGDQLYVAMEDCLNIHLLDNLRDKTQLLIRPVLALADDLHTAINEYYADIRANQNATALLDDLSGASDVELLSESDMDQNSLDVGDSTDAGIVKLVNVIISNAIRERASDIHIEPLEKSIRVRYRIDGVLQNRLNPPKQSHSAIVSRIKVLSELDIAERRLPQDGRLVARILGREVDLRVSVLPTVYGEKVVMRVLDKDAFQRELSYLGLSTLHQEILKKQIIRPHGMVIVTGPTGSGKSTTLYSCINSIKGENTNIITVEDPVEFHMEGVSQVSVNSKIGLTFAAALRSILRQDPDVVLVGEIRDAETADIAVKMALTGHLVFSTLHTNDAVSTITRFVDIGIPALLLSSSLNLIVAQRLVRRICPDCRVQYQEDEVILQKLSLSRDTVLYKGNGCVECKGSGYRGRVGLYEMLELSPEIRRMINRGNPQSEIAEQAKKEGMVTLLMTGVEKLLQGETTIEQILSVVNLE